MDIETLRALPGSRAGTAMLEKLYGSRHARGQARRWEGLVDAAQAVRPSERATFVSSPGRTELGGNHTDHNDGRVLCAAVHLDIVACVSPSTDGRVVLRSAGWPEPFSVDLSSLEPRADERGRPEALIRGTAAAIARRGGRVGGFSGAMDSMVPAGSGLSSSAAVELLFGQIQNALYNGGSLAPADLAMAGQEAENLHFGKPCGLMDQMACALGGVVAIDFAVPGKPSWTGVDFDFEAAGYMLAIVDAGGSHADLTDEYAAIPAEMRAVAAAFGRKSLRGVGAADLAARTRELRAAAGDRAFLRALHFARENDRAAAMASALHAGDMAGYLDMVRASGDSSWRLLQNVCPAGSARDQAVAVAIELTRDFLGDDGAARVHGGGFAGTIQAYVPVARADEYASFAESALGPGSVTYARIRPQGAREIRA